MLPIGDINRLISDRFGSNYPCHLTLWKTSRCHDANYLLGQLAGLDSTEVEGIVILQQVTNVCTSSGTCAIQQRLISCLFYWKTTLMI